MQEPAGRPDERLAAAVLDVARLLADQHHARGNWAPPKTTWVASRQRSHRRHAPPRGEYPLSRLRVAREEGTTSHSLAVTGHQIRPSGSPFPNPGSRNACERGAGRMESENRKTILFALAANL